MLYIEKITVRLILYSTKPYFFKIINAPRLNTSSHWLASYLEVEYLKSFKMLNRNP